MSLFMDAENACNAWSDELKRCFGKRAGDARYTAEGTSTPELARLHAEFRRATGVWRAEMDARHANAKFA